ncbi:MAG: enoyl-CoA hydratase/isomerase family protein [SAR324 cluster bacterium]|nr:enoyl-CoA hydratase/isomerase family protein [SAR324 cluster bacterium]
MNEFVTYQRRGNVGVITVNNPPVNALSHGVREGLSMGLDQGAADGAAKALLLICDGRTFIAGADIREFGKPMAEPMLPTVLAKLENIAKPVIAAVHGTALGGGLEVTLACHYRCGVASALFGLPEVKLGLLPGSGGTQRTPRLIGVEPALKMITSGDPVPAAKALEQGLIDEVIEGDLLEGALAFAEKVVAEGRPLRKIRDLTEHIEAAKADPELFERNRAALAKRARGNEAPLRCLEAVKAAVELPFDEGIARERQLFMEAMGSAQSAALRHVFFAEREVAKIPDVPKDTPVLPVERGAVIGGGTMGVGIAMNFANAGIPVTLIDTSQEQVDQALATVRKNYASTVSKGRLSQEEMDQRVARITGTTDFGQAAGAQLVIEAVFEDMALKKEIFAKLDRLCPAETILASNTSTLDVDEIAGATARPERVVGMHFFSPANVMRLLEIVRGEKTAKDTIATAMATARRMGKVGVLVGVCHGFAGNRMLYQYTREASFLLEEGALPQQIDKVITDFGMPMGPFAMRDLAGLDISWHVRKARRDQGALHGRYDGTVGDRLCEMERFGQKSGAGYYRYEAGNRAPLNDPLTEEVILKASKELGIARREIGDAEILARCLYPMINEGAKILEEGIALRASDLDIIWINGYGFPAHRGGPMFYGEQVGLDSVHKALLEFEKEHGDLWTPSPLLARLAAEGKGFAEA